MGKPIIGVYKITNTLCPEGKYYIGYSCNVKERWTIHKYRLKVGKHGNTYMQRAYNKYGSEYFTYEILQECVTEEEAKNVELSYLEDLTIRDKLYNLHYNNFGGNVISFHPDREGIIEKIKTKIIDNYSKLSKEEKQQKWGQPGVKNGMYGRTHTDDVKQRLSKLGKGRIPVSAKRVSIDNIIYPSIREAGRQLGVSSTFLLPRLKSLDPKFDNYKYVDVKPLDDESTPSLPLLIVDDVDNREV
jgi:group I intron endonuclease